MAFTDKQIWVAEQVFRTKFANMGTTLLDELWADEDFAFVVEAWNTMAELFETKMDEWEAMQT